MIQILNHLIIVKTNQVLKLVKQQHHSHKEQYETPSVKENKSKFDHHGQI